MYPQRALKISSPPDDAQLARFFQLLIQLDLTQPRFLSGVQIIT